MAYAHVLSPFFVAASKQAPVERAVERNQSWSPAIDLGEKDEAFYLVADLPGVKPEAVELAVEEGVLTISGAREAADKSTQRVERISGKFSRSFTLPEAANADEISAKYDFGVLTVTVPKQAKPEPRKIEVQY